MSKIRGFVTQRVMNWRRTASRLYGQYSGAGIAAAASCDISQAFPSFI
jgi:hypothetical protein